MENRILDIIRRNLPKADYLTDYERHTFEKVLNCRTEKVPHMYTCCDSCGTVHPVYQSCKNRMCPVCRCRLNLCRVLMGEPIGSLEGSSGEKPDAIFLFWKYFGVDITECSDCRKGHGPSS
jgi:hypothetical protein